MGEARLVVVDSDVLPEIILKVLEAKKLRSVGEARSSAEACRAVGISRSAYYKYKDSVFAYEDKLSSRIVSLYLILKDEKGVLSSVLAKIYELDANVLTVNQNIPVDGVAAVTVSFRSETGEPDMGRFREKIKGLPGVVEVKMISGE